MHLYETHLPVQSTERAQAFYCDVVGLDFAYRDPARDVVFLWIGPDRQSMLGLWGPDTVHGRAPSKRHFAIAMSLPELLAAIDCLSAHHLVTTNFLGEKTPEPSVIGWMPSAQIYFVDPDGHVVEYIALLDDAPDAAFIGSLSAWRNRS
jgi:lactoylglutathione lyase